jgi:hypothetical protein
MKCAWMIIGDRSCLPRVLPRILTPDSDPGSASSATCICECWCSRRIESSLKRLVPHIGLSSGWSAHIPTPFYQPSCRNSVRLTPTRFFLGLSFPHWLPGRIKWCEAVDSRSLIGYQVAKHRTQALSQRNTHRTWATGTTHWMRGSLRLLFFGTSSTGRPDSDSFSSNPRFCGTSGN